MTHLTSAGGGQDGGANGSEETVGNNLSVPVIFTEGVSLTLPGAASNFDFQQPYDLNGDGVITAGNWDAITLTGGDQLNGYFLFAQKVTGNLWQADSLLIPADTTETTNLFVTTIDWGDSLEGSKPINVGRPTRLEINFSKDLAASLPGDVALEPTMTAYPMQLLANPSSSTEIQGASASTYPLTGTLPNDGALTEELTQASVYADTAGLALQYIVGTPQADDFLWNGDYWVDADPTDAVTIAAPITGLTFGGEITVAGKVSYGLSKGGWRPSQAGTYRATVYFPTTGNLQLDSAQILASTEEEAVVIAEASSAAEPDPTAAVGA